MAVAAARLSFSLFRAGFEAALRLAGSHGRRCARRGGIAATARAARQPISRQARGMPARLSESNGRAGRMHHRLAGNLAACRLPKQEIRPELPMNPTRLAAGLLALLLATAAPIPRAWAATDPTVVVELFTSQGCSSCPPADALLGRLAGEPAVIALSLHVDYWNGLGWTDPFASPAHSARQRRYADSLDDGNRYTSGVYTPQMVIDGRHAAIGHAERGVRAAIAEARAVPDAVQPRFTPDGSAVLVPAGVTETPATVWLVALDRQAETDVARGENAGRTLVNHRVVRTMEPLGTWRGTRTRYAVDLRGHREAGREGLVAVIQEGRTGPILGAAEHRLSAQP
jgi:hypothetical protein